MATMCVQVISLCEKPRDPPLKYIIVDTPGQIEIFTWSASGAIITEAFASGFPTMVAFVIDTPRCAHPQTFMSNMLQVSFSAFQLLALLHLLYILHTSVPELFAAATSTFRRL